MTNINPKKCDQCDSATIQGRYCHEHGCPNGFKVYDFESESWQYPEEESDEVEFIEEDEDFGQDGQVD